MIGGRRPIKGRKPADRRVRVDRPHAPYFRYTGPGQLPGEGRGVGAADGERARRRDGQGVADRAPAGERRGHRPAAVQATRAADLQLGRDLVLRLRDRGDPAGPGAGRGRRPVPVDPGRDRDLRAARGGRDLLPPGLLRLPGRRRRVRRGPPGAGADPRARRRGRPAHRLRDDGRRVDVLGDGPADLDPAGPRAVAAAGRGRRDRPDHGRQPARAAGVGQPVRDPDLPVRGHGADHRRVRPRPHRRRHGGAAPAPARGRAVRDARR